MRVMVLVKATADSEKGFVRTPETDTLMAAMGKFNDELEAAGILPDADGRQPTSDAVRIRFDGPDRAVTPGRFANAQVAGYWLRNVKDMDEAIQRAKRCPKPMPGPSDLEIRPIYEAADLR